MLGSCCKQYCVTARHGKKTHRWGRKKGHVAETWNDLCQGWEFIHVCSVWQTHCEFVARTEKNHPVVKRSSSTLQNNNWYFVTHVTVRASTAQIGNDFRWPIVQYWTCKFALFARMDKKVVLWRKQFGIEWNIFLSQARLTLQITIFPPHYFSRSLFWYNMDLGRVQKMRRKLSRE